MLHAKYVRFRFCPHLLLQNECAKLFLIFFFWYHHRHHTGTKHQFNVPFQLAGRFFPQRHPGQVAVIVRCRPFSPPWCYNNNTIQKQDLDRVLTSTTSLVRTNIKSYERHSPSRTKPGTTALSAGTATLHHFCCTASVPPGKPFLVAPLNTVTRTANPNMHRLPVPASASVVTWYHPRYQNSIE